MEWGQNMSESFRDRKGSCCLGARRNHWDPIENMTLTFSSRERGLSSVRFTLASGIFGRETVGVERGCSSKGNSIQEMEGNYHLKDWSELGVVSYYSEKHKMARSVWLGEWWVISWKVDWTWFREVKLSVPHSHALRAYHVSQPASSCSFLRALSLGPTLPSHTAGRKHTPHLTQQPSAHDWLKLLYKYLCSLPRGLC